MNKKVSLGLTLSLIFISVALAVTITMTVLMFTYNNLMKDVSDRSGMYSGLSEIDDVIRENYYGEINENLLNSMISKGYTEGLGDRYSTYMTADEYVSYKQLEKGEKGGIGVVAVYDEKSGGIYISEVSDGSPAKLQGMSKGDVITEIDGTKVTALNALNLMQALEGDKLTEVTVTFTHNKEAKTVKVARGYTMQTVYYSTINEKVGYIKIIAFYRNTEYELEKALKYMNEHSVSSVIFDVRNNADGFVPYVTACLDLMVPVASEGTGALATAVDKNENTIKTFTSDSDAVSMSMCILVNAGTSGAAELFACDLRDFGMATLVGTTTAGNGTMQKIFELSDGGAVRLTVAKILPYKSKSYDGEGLKCDYEVSLNAEQNDRLQMLSFEEDAQYQKALSLITNSQQG